MSDDGPGPVRTFLAWVGGYSAAHPRVVFAVVAVLLVASGASVATSVQVNTGVDLYLDDDAAAAEDWATLEDEYDTGNTVFAVVETENVYDPETIRTIDRLDARYSEIDGMRETLSLADVVRAGNGGELPETERGVREAIDRFEDRDDAATTLARVHPGENTAVVVATYGSVPVPDESKYGLGLVPLQEADVVASEFESATASVTVPDATSVTVTGEPLVEDAAFDWLLPEVVALLAVAFLLLVAVVFLVMRGRLAEDRNAVLPVGSAVVGLAFTVGTFGYSLDTVSLCVVPVALGLGVDYGLQVQTRYIEERRTGHSPEAAAAKAVGTAGRALLIVMPASVVGLGTLVVSGVPPVRRFGLTAAFGVVVTVGLALTLLPASLAYFDPARNGAPGFSAGRITATVSSGIDRIRTDGGDPPDDPPGFPWIDPPSEDDVDRAIDAADHPPDPDQRVYFLRMVLPEAGNADDGWRGISALRDAFDLLGTVPSEERIVAGDHDGRVDAVFGSYVEESEVQTAFDSIEEVTGTLSEEVTARVRARDPSLAGEESSDGPEGTGPPWIDPGVVAGEGEIRDAHEEFRRMDRVHHEVGIDEMERELDDVEFEGLDPDDDDVGFEDLLEDVPDDSDPASVTVDASDVPGADDADDDSSVNWVTPPAPHEVLDPVDWSALATAGGPGESSAQSTRTRSPEEPVEWGRLVSAPGADATHDWSPGAVKSRGDATDATSSGTESASAEPTGAAAARAGSTGGHTSTARSTGTHSSGRTASSGSGVRSWIGSVAGAVLPSWLTRSRRSDRLERGVGAVVSRVLAPHALFVVVVAFLLLTAGLVAYPGVGSTQEVSDFWSDDLDEVREFEAASGTMESPQTLYLVVETDDPYGPKTFLRTSTVQRQLLAREHVGAVESPVTAVEASHGGIPVNESEIRTIVADRAAEGTTTVRPPGERPNALVLELHTDDVRGQAVPGLARSIENDVEGELPRATATVTGRPVVNHAIAGTVSSGPLLPTLLGLVLVLLVSTLALRSPRAAATVIGSAVLTAVLVLGLVLSVFGVPWNPLTTTVVAIALVFGIEYGVQVHDRYREERKGGADAVEAVETAVVRLSRPILASGLATMVGFGILAVSRFPLVVEFGRALVPAVALAILGGMVVLPAVLLTPAWIREWADDGSASAESA